MKQTPGEEFGKDVAEKRCWHLALTSFAVEVWEKSEKPIYP